MKKQLKILASVFASVMLAISLASCDLSMIQNLFPTFEEPKSDGLENELPKNDDLENEQPQPPAVRRIHDFEDVYGEKDWMFYNAAHTGEKDVCGEIVDDGTGNHVMKIYGEGNKWEGIEFNAPRYLGMQANKIKLKVTSSKEIENLRFSLEYAKHQFIEGVVDIPVGTNEIEIVFEQDFSAIFSFSVKTNAGLYDEICIDDIIAIENKNN